MSEQKGGVNGGVLPNSQRRKTTPVDFALKTLGERVVFRAFRNKEEDAQNPRKKRRRIGKVVLESM